MRTDEDPPKKQTIPIVLKRLKRYTTHMGSNIFLIIGICAVLGFALFNSFVAGTAKTFSINPSSSATQGKAIREEASEQATDTAEKNRRLMEKVREQRGRNKF